MQEPDKPDIKPDWKDFVALVIAAYSILLPPLLVIIGAGAAVLLLFSFAFR